MVGQAHCRQGEIPVDLSLNLEQSDIRSHWTFDDVKVLFLSRPFISVELSKLKKILLCHYLMPIYTLLSVFRSKSVFISGFQNGSNDISDLPKVSLWSVNSCPTHRWVCSIEPSHQLSQSETCTYTLWIQKKKKNWPGWNWNWVWYWLFLSTPLLTNATTTPPAPLFANYWQKCFHFHHLPIDLADEQKP